MKDESLISVIIPIFNVERYLEKCIISVVKQTYKKLEIILVDDGSNDNGSYICDRLAMEDNRIRVIHQKNRGLVLARKKGLEIAKGDYIAFVDADDWIEENMYEELLKIMVYTHADFIHSDCYHEFENGNVAQKIHYIGKSIYDERDDKARILYDSLFARNKREKINPSIWSKLFKADFAKACYYRIPEGQNYGEDILFLCECIISSKKIAVLNRSFYHYLVRQNSLAHHITEDKIIDISLLYKSLKELLLRYGYYENFKDDLKIWLLYNQVDYIQKVSNYKIEITKYYFKSIELIKNRRIVIYGAGKVGKDYYSQLCKYHDCTIIAWVDSNYKQYINEYMEVISLEKLYNKEFDYLIIAVDSSSVAQDIVRLLIDKGISKNKILWEQPMLFEKMV